MKPTMTAIALALGIFATTPAVAAAAQEPAAAAGEERKISISKEAYPAVKALQDAVDANDLANVPARVAAAQAVAKTADDRYMIAQLQLRAAAASKDDATIKQAIQAVLASGTADPAQVVPLHLNLGKLQFNAKEYDQAAVSFEKVLAAQPTNIDALTSLAETRFSQGRKGDAVGLIQKAILTRTAAGQKADEAWYKRAMSIAFQEEMPAAVELSRQWVAAYPSVVSWRDAIRIYRKLGNPTEAMTLDMLRLARATGSLDGDNDFESYMFQAGEGGTPGEAKAVLQEAIAANKIDPARDSYKQGLPVVLRKAAGESVNLEKKTAAALAGSAAAPVVAVADSNFGRGDYGKAAELYRTALGKSGADADLINLHLGMALARAGDKAGAAAALKAVNGPRAEVAKYWLVYVGSAA